MKKIIRIFCIILSIMMLLSISACGNSQNAAKNNESEKKVELKLLIHNTDDGVKEAMDYVMDHLKDKLPEVNVKLDMATGDVQNYETKVRTLISAGNAPDVWWERGGSFAVPIMQAKAALPIEKYLDDINFWDKVIPSVKVSSDDGHIYGIPFETAFYEIILYNTKIFKENNLTPPKTAEEFENIVKILKSKNILPIALAGKDGWPAAMFIEGFAYSIDPQITPKIVKGNAKFSDEPYRKSAELTKHLIDSGAFTSNVSLTDYGTAVGLFDTGKAGMMANGSWAIADSFKALNGNCDYFYYPVLDESKVSEYGTSVAGGPKKDSGLFVSSNTQHPDEAVKLALAVGELMAQFKYEEKGDASIVYKPEAYGWKNKIEIPQPLQKLAKDSMNFKNVYGLVQDVMPTAPSSQGVMQNCSKFMTGQTSVNDFLEEMDEAAVAK